MDKMSGYKSSKSKSAVCNDITRRNNLLQIILESATFNGPAVPNLTAKGGCARYTHRLNSIRTKTKVLSNPLLLHEYGMEAHPPVKFVC